MKRILTLSLVPLIVAASVFMILESGEYYSTFYKGNIHTGYWSAALVELFLTVFTFLHFKRAAALNSILKLVIGMLFVVMIAGASLKIVSPLLAELSTSSSNTKLINFLVKESSQSSTNLQLLKGQKSNMALQAKHQRRMAEELLAGLKKEIPEASILWTAIIFTTFLRFTVQLANLVMAHILGRLWREHFKTTRKYAKKVKVATPKNVVSIPKKRAK